MHGVSDSHQTKVLCSCISLQDCYWKSNGVVRGHNQRGLILPRQYNIWCGHIKFNSDLYTSYWISPLVYNIMQVRVQPCKHMYMHAWTCVILSGVPILPLSLGPGGPFPTGSPKFYDTVPGTWVANYSKTGSSCSESSSILHSPPHNDCRAPLNSSRHPTTLWASAKLTVRAPPSV